MTKKGLRLIRPRGRQLQRPIGPRRRGLSGTDIVFEIDRKQDKTELRFTHVGLAPSIECYGGCSRAWGFYINDSLRSLITTGKGQSNETEEENRERASR